MIVLPGDAALSKAGAAFPPGPDLAGRDLVVGRGLEGRHHVHRHHPCARATGRLIQKPSTAGPEPSCTTLKCCMDQTETTVSKPGTKTERRPMMIVNNYHEWLRPRRTGDLAARVLQHERPVGRREQAWPRAVEPSGRCFLFFVWRLENHERRIRGVCTALESFYGGAFCMESHE